MMHQLGMDHTSNTGVGVPALEHHDDNGSRSGSQDGSGSSLGRSTPSGSGSGSSAGRWDPANKLFIGGLSWQTNAQRLRNYFEQFGNVTDVLVKTDPVTLRGRGFGFITFSEPEAVLKVLREPREHTLDGKNIDPKLAIPRGPPLPAETKKIFVGGVSQETSADEVKAYFSQFGKIENAYMLTDQHTKKHRGFGFVIFESAKVVDRVCQIHIHTIKNKKVECKKAEPKDLSAQRLVALAGHGNLVLQNHAIAQQLQSAAAAQALMMQGKQILTPQQLQQQQALAASVNCYNKLLPAYHAAFHRYAPYPAVPSVATLLAAPAPRPCPVPPINPYSLLNTNVDMSSFQGFDWGL